MWSFKNSRGIISVIPSRLYIYSFIILRVTVFISIRPSNDILKKREKTKKDIENAKIIYKYTNIM